jgi:diguanylate cyclase (GGDEF)-like protein/PAS domain S-box-containing protein
MNTNRRLRTPVLCLIVFLGVMGASALLAYLLSSRAKDAASESLARASSSIQTRIAAEVDLETSALLRLASKWALTDDEERLGWDLDVQQVLSGHPSLLAIGWIPVPAETAKLGRQQYLVSWVYPQLYSTALTRLHGLVVANRASLVADVFEKKRLEITEAIHVADRGKAFAVYAPAIQDGEVVGATIGIFHLQILLDSTLDRLAARDFSVQILDGSEMVYERGDKKAKPDSLESRGPLNVFASRWTLRVWPNPTQAAEQEERSTAILFAGGILGLLLSGLVWFFASPREAAPTPLALPPDPSLEIELRVYESALAAAPAPLLLLADDRSVVGPKIHFANDAFLEISGLRLRNMAGKSLDVIFASASGLRQQLRSGQPFTSAVSLATASGALEGILSANPLPCDPDHPQFWLCNFVPPSAEPVTMAPVFDLASLLEQLPRAAIATDASGATAFVNSQWEKLTGWSGREIAGTAPPIAFESNLSAARQPATLDVTGKSGQRLVVLAWAVPLAGAVAPGGTLFLIADRTNTAIDFEGLERSEAHYRRIVEGTSSILAVLDESFRIQYMNPAAKAALDLDPELLSGLPATELFPGVAADPGVPQRIEVPHRDGAPREFQTIVDLLDNDAVAILSAQTVPQEHAPIQNPAWFLDAIPELVLTFDAERRLTWLNRAAEDAYALSVGHTAGKTLSEALPDWLQVPSRDVIFSAVESAASWTGTISTLTPQGRELVHEASWTLLRDSAGAPAGSVAILRDITEKQRAVDTFTADRTAQALNSLGSSDGLWDWNLRTNELYLSPRWKEMLRYGETALGSTPETWFDLVDRADLPNLRAKIQRHLAGQDEFLEAEYRIRTLDGGYRWMLARGLATRNSAGEPTRLVGLQTDIQDQKESDEQLLFEAFHDPTTGLANRALLFDRLSGLLSRGNYSFTVLFADLAQFQAVNATLGARGGDRALHEVAQRITRALPSGAFLARHGSDEFAAIIPQAEDLDQRELTAKIQYELAKPFSHQGKSVSFQLQVGFAGAAEGMSAEDLIAQASRAMTSSKLSATALTEAAVPSSPAVSVPVADAAPGSGDEIRRAIAAGDFRVFYHPVISLETGEVAGLEALVRWQHPSRGLLTPKDFLPAAEASGAVIELDRWVMKEACAKAADLNHRFRRVETLVLTVNLSSQHFADAALTARLEEILSEAAINPRYLRLDLNERSLGLSEGLSPVADNLKRLRVQLSLDGFQETQGALPAWPELPIDRVKLNSGLVRGLAAGRNVEEVRSLIAAAELRSIQVVAEGVETLEQLAALRELKCHLAQGFYFTQPQPAQDTERLLARSPRW